MPNPSFEGIYLQLGPPPDWEVCEFNSSPNVQPGKYSVFLPPSHGETYIGVYCRIDGTWEDLYSVLDVPLSKDSCYIFQIDMAYWPVLSFAPVDPCVVKIYGSNSTCDKTNLLWSSPPVDNQEWMTAEFMIHNSEFDITDLIIEAYWVGTVPYRGYVLLDHIRINQTPQFELGNDTTITLCDNDSVLLDPGSGFNGYLWQNGSTNQTFTVDTTGLYWVQAFNAQGCSWTDSVYITIEEYMPMESGSIDSTMVCVGQEVTIAANILNGAQPFSYEWLGLPDTTQSITVIADSTMYYYVLVTDKCDNEFLDSIKIVALPGPDIDIGNDTLICYGEEYVISAGGGYSAYLWQDDSQDSVFTVTGPGIFWVQVWDALGCSNSDSIQIEFYPEVVPQLGNDTVLCISDNITLDAGSGWVSILWYDGSTAQTNTVSDPGYYWVTVTDENGCTGTDTISVDLSPAVVVSLGGDTTLCFGDFYVLDPGNNFTSYLWQDGSTEPFLPIVSPGVYWVEVTDTYGCTGADTVSINFVPTPEVDLGNDTTICTGSTITLDPGNQYISYLWQDNSTLPFYMAFTTGYYSVTVTNIYDCPASDEIFVEVTSPDIDLGPDTILCIGDTMLLDPGQGYSSYLWQDNTTQTLYPVIDEGIYTVLVTDTYDCISMDTVTIEGLAKPVADLGQDKALCEGETVLLETIQGPFEYSWNGEPGDHTLEVSLGGTYTVEVSNICGAITDQVEVIEYPVPEIYLGQDQVMFEGDVIELDAGEGFDNYVWQDGSGEQYFIITESNYNTNDPYYYVEVTDGPCKNSDTTRIILFMVKIPNVFTPNGDNNNDKFLPMEDGWNGVNNHHIDIFNRWGEKVWESDDFESGWDGKRNGNYVSDGTYFWVLDVYFGESHIKQRVKGTVTLLGSGD